ncbi:MAG: tripartite tricarboxylate transporter TctB family protein [Rubrivivax sp.]|jgi:hypothetical protein|nr:tripartite tricarboxylate transporter TctB family protein [Rubrivivax sp.]
MKIRSQVDFWSGVVFFVVGLAFAVGATEYRMGTSARPGPGYFPLGLGALLALVGLFVLVGALGREPDEDERIARPVWRPLVVVVGAVLAAGFLLPRAGMLLTLPLVIVLTALASSEFRLREALGLAAVLTVGSWLLFVVGLKLRIPVMPTVF